MGWLQAGGDYEVSLEQGKVICRNAQGKRLKSLPKALCNPLTFTLGLVSYGRSYW